MRLARHLTEAKVDDVRIDAIAPLLPPACLMEEMPISETVAESVSSTREQTAVLRRGMIVSSSSLGRAPSTIQKHARSTL